MLPLGFSGFMSDSEKKFDQLLSVGSENSAERERQRERERETERQTDRPVEKRSNTKGESENVERERCERKKGLNVKLKFNLE